MRSSTIAVLAAVPALAKPLSFGKLGQRDDTTTTSETCTTPSDGTSEATPACQYEYTWVEGDTCASVAAYIGVSLGEDVACVDRDAEATAYATYSCLSSYTWQSGDTCSSVSGSASLSMRDFVRYQDSALGVGYGNCDSALSSGDTVCLARALSARWMLGGNGSGQDGDGSGSSGVDNGSGGGTGSGSGQATETANSVGPSPTAGPATSPTETGSELSPTYTVGELEATATKPGDALPSESTPGDIGPATRETGSETSPTEISVDPEQTVEPEPTPTGTDLRTSTAENDTATSPTGPGASPTKTDSETSPIETAVAPLAPTEPEPATTEVPVEPKVTS
ncbi:hypothetical protein GE09DRAFT_1213281 [Coniochaeta sp. 2T2.1]|nr:hypothetical protein GE09DRAFT_1213281 [Coniochaeta sp. 2T2.1]